MKKFVIIIVCFFCCLNFQLLATNDSLLKKNAIYIELFGNGIKGSFNYDRTIKWNQVKFSNIVRVGLGYDYSGSDDSLDWSAKVLVTEVNFLTNKIGVGQFEFGLGYTYYLDPIPYYKDNVLMEKKEWSVNFLRLGYRIQRGHAIGRAAFIPSYSRQFWNEKKYALGFWAGISLGYCI